MPIANSPPTPCADLGTPSVPALIRKKSVGARRASLLTRYGKRTACRVRMVFKGLSANLDGLGDLGKVQIDDFYSSHGPSTAPSRCQRTLLVSQDWNPDPRIMAM